MKRGCAILLVLVVLTALLAACTKNETPESTPPASPTTPTSTPAPTTPPDFADIDFSGNWAVSAVYDLNGQPVSTDQLSQMGADFTLELTDSGAYFIYSVQGALIGQGQYAVSGNELILSAGGLQTVYIIQDADTLRGKAEDSSVTVMTRCADTGEGEGEAPTEEDTEETNTEETTSE